MEAINDDSGCKSDEFLQARDTLKLLLQDIVAPQRKDNVKNK